MWLGLKAIPINGLIDNPDDDQSILLALSGILWMKYANLLPVIASRIGVCIRADVAVYAAICPQPVSLHGPFYAVEKGILICVVKCSA